MIVPSGSLSAGSFVSPVASRNSSREPLTEERDRMAVGGDHLLVLDPGVTECLLHPATRMPARASVIAMALTALAFRPSWVLVQSADSLHLRRLHREEPIARALACP
jgi:hypothetical protein